MSYLEMALAALQATTSAGEAGAQRCSFISQAPNHAPATEPPQARPPTPPVTCAAACPWYELNPWTRDPALGAWCHHWMEHLVVGGAACEEFSRGEVLSRQPHKKVTATTLPNPPERTFTCADCTHFEASHGPNPRQSWGRCLKRNRGRFGCATACEAALNLKF
jgi:hypothetical protein